MQPTRFDERADEILKYLKTDVRYGEHFLPRPFFVELTGSPDSGKSTTIDKLYHTFKDLGFKTFKPLEGAEAIQHIPRTTPLYNIRTAQYAIAQLIDLSHSHTYDLVLFDRCAFDGYYWMMYWLAKGKLAPEEAELYQDYFLSDFWVKNLDAAFFVVCDPEIAMRRNQEDNISNKIGETTNPANLKVLVDRLHQAYRELSPKFPQLEVVDTSTMPKKDMIQYFGDKILSAMEAKVMREAKAQTAK